jgi:hypothetical protein
MLWLVDVFPCIREAFNRLPLTLIDMTIVEDSDSLARHVVIWPPASVCQATLEVFELFSLWIIDHQSTKFDLVAIIKPAFHESLNSTGFAVDYNSCKSTNKWLNIELINAIVVALVATDGCVSLGTLFDQQDLREFGIGKVLREEPDVHEPSPVECFVQGNIPQKVELLELRLLDSRFKRCCY